MTTQPDTTGLIEHADAVWLTVIRIINDEEIARDCYQQTFLDAMRLDAGQIQNWRAVMCKIATRRAMDALRQIYRQRATKDFTENDSPFRSPPDKQLMHNELRQRVREVLMELPQTQAMAFWLRHIEGFQPKEIATQLEIDSGHVRVLVHRAIIRLRTELGPAYDRSFTLREDA